jgi:hypothetical protein
MDVPVHVLLYENGSQKALQLVAGQTTARAQVDGRIYLEQALGKNEADTYAITMMQSGVIRINAESAKETEYIEVKDEKPNQESSKNILKYIRDTYTKTETEKKTLNKIIDRL